MDMILTCPSCLLRPSHHRDSRRSGEDSSRSCECGRSAPCYKKLERFFTFVFIFVKRIIASQTLRHRSPVQKGCMSKMRTVPSIELVSTLDPSGLSIIPVTVSVCPLISVTTAFFLKSHTLTILSMPALITWLASSLKQTAVT